MEDIISRPPPDLPSPTYYNANFMETLVREWTKKDKRVAKYINKERLPLTSTTSSDAFAKGLEDGQIPSNKDNPPMLHLEIGDIVEVLERWTGGKWRGVKLLQSGVYGQSGFFSTDAVKPIIGARVRAIRTFERPKPFLSFFPHENIRIIWLLNNWWCWGRTRRGIGLVPLNYVEPYPKDDQQIPQHSKSSTRLLHGHDLGTDLALVYSNYEEVPSMARHSPVLRCRAVWDTREVDSSVLSLKRHDQVDIIDKYNSNWWLGISGKKVGLVQVNCLKLQVDPPFGPYYVRTLYRRRKSTNNTLNFDTGMLLEVVGVFEDGWYVGVNEKGEYGLFPQNYVSPLLDRRMFDMEDC